MNCASKFDVIKIQLLHLSEFYRRVLVYLRPRGASNLALEKCVAALREARIPKNLLENGRRGAFHLYSHLYKKIELFLIFFYLFFKNVSFS